MCGSVCVRALYNAWELCILCGGLYHGKKVMGPLYNVWALYNVRELYHGEKVMGTLNNVWGFEQCVGTSFWEQGDGDFVCNSILRYLFLYYGH